MFYLFKRGGSPYWYVAVKDARGADGYIRKSTKCKLKREAREAAEAIHREIAAEHLRSAEPVRREPTLPPASQPRAVVVARRTPTLTWLDAAEIFLRDGELRDSTKRGYAAMIGTIAKGMGDFLLGDVTKADVKAYVNQRRAADVVVGNRKGPPRGAPRRVKDATIKREISCMSSVFRFAIEYDLPGAPEDNPLLTFDRSFLRESPLLDRGLRPVQFEAVLAACETPEARRIIIILAGTGMRSSELTGLTWGEVDFGAAMIEFGNLDATRTKTGRARRIPLFPQVVDALKEQAVAQGFGLPGTQPCPDAQAIVFPSPRKGGQRKSLNNVLRRPKRVTGMASLRIHDLRHTFASWLLQGGVDPFAISAVLGHSTLSITKRYARHVSDSIAGQLRAVSLPIS